MYYLTISFNHKNSTLAIREKLAFPETELEACLRKINEHEAINESFLVSTCNRMEIFASCSSVTDASKHIFTLLSKRSGISLEELEGRADFFEDQGAIHHLFTVASSLDSMVVGETQIAGQLKDAYRFSHMHGYCAQKISRAVHYAFKCAAEVRRVTDISSKPVSVASVAVAQAKQKVRDFNGKRALVIGAGEMSVIIAKHLVSNGADVTIMNRTRSKAEEIAADVGCRVKDFEELPDAINEYKLIFTSTGSKDPIIVGNMVEECDFVRYWFDIAVPRDIEEIEHETIHLFRVDDLKDIVSDNLTMREDEAKAAYAVVGRYTIEFFEWLKSLSVEPMIKEIYLRAHAAAVEETERVMSSGFIDEKYREQALKMSEQAIKRFLHNLTKNMRDVTGQTKSDMLIESMKYLLGTEGENLPEGYRHSKYKGDV
jgi:glutamyl-tRNA reductase